MSDLSHLLHSGGIVGVTVGLLYTSTVAVVALTAVLAPTADRRRDARDALKILLNRRSGKQGARNQAHKDDL